MWSGVARRWRLLALLAALGVAWRGWRVDVATTRSHLHRTSPLAAAHALADFANHRSLYPDIHAWWVESEKSNLTWWHYKTRFSCGARCAGFSEVTHAAGSPGAMDATGPGAAHALRFTHQYCFNLPLLPLPKFCDVVETTVQVDGVAGSGQGRGGAGGTTLALSAQARCSLWTGGAACGALVDLPARYVKLLSAIA